MTVLVTDKKLDRFCQKKSPQGELGSLLRRDEVEVHPDPFLIVPQNLETRTMAKTSFELDFRALGPNLGLLQIGLKL